MDANTNVGIFVTVLPDETTPSWLYVTWDDDQKKWIGKAAEVDSTATQPPEANSLELKTFTMPLNILPALAFQHGRAKELCLVFHEKRIEAYQLDPGLSGLKTAWYAEMADAPKPAQDYQLSKKTLYKPGRDKTYEQIYNKHEIKLREQSSDLTAFSLALKYNFFDLYENNLNQDEISSLEKVLQTLQENDHNETLRTIDQLYFVNLPGLRNAYIEKVASYLKIQKILNIKDNKASATALSRNKGLTDQQLHDIIVNYQNDSSKYKQRLKLLADCCDRLAAAQDLIQTFNDDELVDMTTNQFYSDPKYLNFSKVARFLDSSRLSQILTQLSKKGWEIKNKEALKELCSKLDENQQSILLQTVPYASKELQSKILFETRKAFLDDIGCHSNLKETLLKEYPNPQHLSSIDNFINYLGHFSSEKRLQVLARVPYPQLKTLCPDNKNFGILFDCCMDSKERQLLLNTYYHSDYFDNWEDFKNFINYIFQGNLSYLLALETIQSNLKTWDISLNNLITDCPSKIIAFLTCENSTFLQLVRTEKDIESLKQGSEPSQSTQLVEINILLAIEHMAKIALSPKPMQIIAQTILAATADHGAYITKWIDNIPATEDQKIVDFYTSPVFNETFAKYPKQRTYFLNQTRIKTVLQWADASVPSLMVPPPGHQPPPPALINESREAFIEQIAKIPQSLDSMSDSYDTLMQKFQTAIHKHSKPSSEGAKQQPPVYLTLAGNIYTQILFAAKKEPALQKDKHIHQVLIGCTRALEDQSDQTNLTNLQKLSTQLPGHPSREAQTLGGLLYAFAGILIIAGILAAIPLSQGNVLMNIFGTTQLAKVVSHSLATSLTLIGSGIAVGGATHLMGFFSQRYLAKDVSTLSKEIQNVARMTV